MTGLDGMEIIEVHSGLVVARRQLDAANHVEFRLSRSLTEIAVNGLVVASDEANIRRERDRQYLALTAIGRLNGTANLYDEGRLAHDLYLASRILTEGLATPPSRISAWDLMAGLADQPEPEALPLLGVPGLVPRYEGTILAGYGKGGKTTLLAAGAQEWSTRGLSVLWVTEESQKMWDRRMRRWPAGPPPNLCFVFGLGLSREELLAAGRDGPDDVVIYDTVRNLFVLEDENDNSEVVRVLTFFEAPLRAADKTRVYVHHDKEGGAHGKSIVGAGAFLSAVDRALMLRFGQQPRRRRIEVLGRIDTVPDLVYEMRDDGQLVAIDRNDLTADAVKRRAAAALTPVWMKTTEIKALIGAPAPSDEQIRQALIALAGEGIAERHPPIDEEAKGQTVRWRRRIEGALPNLPRNLPPLKENLPLEVLPR